MARILPEKARWRFCADIFLRAKFSGKSIAGIVGFGVDACVHGYVDGDVDVDSDCFCIRRAFVQPKYPFFGVLLLVLARLILFGPTRVHRCNLRVMVRLSLGGVAYFYRSLNVLRDLVLLAV